MGCRRSSRWNEAVLDRGLGMICVESGLQSNPTRYLPLGRGLRGSGKPSKRSLPVPSRPRHMLRLTTITLVNTTTYHKRTVFKTWLYSFSSECKGKWRLQKTAQPTDPQQRLAGQASCFLVREAI